MSILDFGLHVSFLLFKMFKYENEINNKNIILNIIVAFKDLGLILYIIINKLCFKDKDKSKDNDNDQIIYRSKIPLKDTKFNMLIKERNKYLKEDQIKLFEQMTGFVFDNL